MTVELVMATPMMARVQEALDRDFRVHRLWKAPDPAALLAEVAPRARGVATANKADAALMDALPALEIVASFAVGVDGIDVDHARRRGIIVTNTPDVLTDEVANFTLGMVMTLTRRIPEASAYLRAGLWEAKGAFPLTATILGRRWGIVAMGRIGQAVARRLEVCGAEVVWYGPRPKPELPWRHYADLVAMARDCDGIILLCPGGEATRGLVDARVLDALGPEGFLVNAARGSVVDEDALIAAMRDGRIAGAALDVFPDEPRVNPAFLELEGLQLTPHLGSSTVRTRNAMADLVIDNLRLHFSGQPVKNPV